MIPKIVPRRAYHRKDLGAFAAAIYYAGEKASCVATRNIVGTWHNAAHQMRTTAKLGRRQTGLVLYHISLSWPEQERPSDLQMFDAADHVIAALGAQDHEAVLAIHDDTSKRHIHIVLNRFHMATGRLLSTAHDFTKLEKACREIELAQGWAADRGRFDVEICEIDGQERVTLVPKPEWHWDKKCDDRRFGFRRPSDGELRRARGSLAQPLAPRLGEALKKKIRNIIDNSTSWPQIKSKLGRMGLSLRPHRNGVRLYIDHAGDHMRASDLGSNYSRGKLEKRLGEIPDHALRRPRVHLHKSAAEFTIEGRADMAEAELFPTKAIRGARLSEAYTLLTAAEGALGMLARINFQDVPRTLELTNGARIEDLGGRIIANRSVSPRIQAEMIMALAFGHGWTTVSVEGSDEFCEACARSGAALGIQVEGYDAPTSQTRASVTTAYLTDRVHQKAQNQRKRERVVEDKREIHTTEARLAIEFAAAIGTSRAPLPRALRSVLKQDFTKKLSEAGDARRVEAPLSTPDITTTINMTPKISRSKRLEELREQFWGRQEADHTSIRHMIEYHDIVRGETEKGAPPPPWGTIDHPVLGMLLPHLSTTGAVIGFERTDPENGEVFIPGGRRGIGIYSLPRAPARLLVCRSLSEILRAIPQIDHAQGLGFISIGGETPSPDARVNLTKFQNHGYKLMHVTEFNHGVMVSAGPEVDKADDPAEDSDEPGLMP